MGIRCSSEKITQKELDEKKSIIDKAAKIMKLQYENMEQRNEFMKKLYNGIEQEETAINKLYESVTHLFNQYLKFTDKDLKLTDEDLKLTDYDLKLKTLEFLIEYIEGGIYTNEEWKSRSKCIEQLNIYKNRIIQQKNRKNNYIKCKDDSIMLEKKYISMNEDIQILKDEYENLLQKAKK